jgi:hypothetical protein
MMRISIALLAAGLGLANLTLAQTAGDLNDWYAHDRERREENSANQEAVTSARRSAIDSGVSITNQGVGIMVTGRELVTDWQALDNLDASCDAALSGGGPTVPSSCADSDACRSCYQEATRSIDFNRRYIERARCITAANLKMAKSAEAFGDSASGVHGVMGLSWQLQGKPQIKEATDKLKKTYVEKAGVYLAALEKGLQKLGQCEAEHFNEPDWYARYGWTYMTFMRSKYQSAPSPD